MSPLISVTILDDANAAKCDGRCGLDFSSPDTVKQITGSLNNMFGNTVKLEYLDIAKASKNHIYTEIVKKVKTNDLSLPILLVNDKLRISGYFDIHLLKSTIQIDLDLLNEEV